MHWQEHWQQHNWRKGLITHEDVLYLETDDAKTVFFDFAVNKHGMSSRSLSPFTLLDIQHDFSIFSKHY